MSPAAFLRDRALSVAVAIVCAIAIGSVVAVLGAGPDASVLAACIVLACAAFALTVDYARRRAFYRDLEQVVGDLDRTYYATALIEPPDFLEGAWLTRPCRRRGRPPPTTWPRTSSKPKPTAIT